jgi:hypothetical protein
MQPAQGVAELLDFSLGEILFMFRFGQLVGDVIQIAQNALKHFPDVFEFCFGLFEQRTGFWRKLALRAAFPLLA